MKGKGKLDGRNRRISGNQMGVGETDLPGMMPVSDYEEDTSEVGDACNEVEEKLARDAPAIGRHREDKVESDTGCESEEDEDRKKLKEFRSDLQFRTQDVGVVVDDIADFRKRGAEVRGRGLGGGNTTGKRQRQWTVVNSTCLEKDEPIKRSDKEVNSDVEVEDLNAAIETDREEDGESIYKYGGMEFTRQELDTYREEHHDEVVSDMMNSIIQQQDSEDDDTDSDLEDMMCKVIIDRMESSSEEDKSDSELMFGKGFQRIMEYKDRKVKERLKALAAVESETSDTDSDDDEEDDVTYESDFEEEDIEDTDEEGDIADDESSETEEEIQMASASEESSQKKEDASEAPAEDYESDFEEDDAEEEIADNEECTKNSDIDEGLAEEYESDFEEEEIEEQIEGYQVRSYMNANEETEAGYESDFEEDEIEEDIVGQEAKSKIKNDDINEAAAVEYESDFEEEDIEEQIVGQEANPQKECIKENDEELGAEYESDFEEDEQDEEELGAEYESDFEEEEIEEEIEGYIPKPLRRSNTFVVDYTSDKEEEEIQEEIVGVIMKQREEFSEKPDEYDSDFEEEEIEEEIEGRKTVTINASSRDEQEVGTYESDSEVEEIEEEIEGYVRAQRSEKKTCILDEEYLEMERQMDAYMNYHVDDEIEEEIEGYPNRKGARTPPYAADANDSAEDEIEEQIEGEYTEPKEEQVMMDNVASFMADPEDMDTLKVIMSELKGGDDGEVIEEDSAVDMSDDSLDYLIEFEDDTEEEEIEDAEEANEEQMELIRQEIEAELEARIVGGQGDDMIDAEDADSEDAGNDVEQEAAYLAEQDEMDEPSEQEDTGTGFGDGSTDNGRRSKDPPGGSRGPGRRMPRGMRRMRSP